MTEQKGRGRTRPGLFAGKHTNRLENAGGCDPGQAWGRRNGYGFRVVLLKRDQIVEKNDFRKTTRIKETAVKGTLYEIPDGVRGTCQTPLP